MGSLQGGTLANIKNRVMKVTFGGVDLGFTRSGIDVEFAPEYENVDVEEFGGQALDAMLSGAEFNITVRLAEFSASLLRDMIPGSAKTVDGGKESLGYGKAAGFRVSVDSKLLVLHPIDLGASELNEDLNVWKAYVATGPVWKHAHNEIQEYEVTFKALIDVERSGDDKLFMVGDPTAGADETPPTVTVVPADAASSIAVDTNIVWTFSEAIRLATMTNANFFLRKADGTAAPGALSYSAGDFKVTLNPTDNLSASTDYVAVATENVTDVAGNALADTEWTNFETA